MSWYQIVALDTTDSPNVEKMGRYFMVFGKIEDHGEPRIEKSSNTGRKLPSNLAITRKPQKLGLSGRNVFRWL